MSRRRGIIVLVLVIGAIAGLAFHLSHRNAGLYRVTVLPSLGGDFTAPDAINDRGQIVGTSFVPGGDPHLFLWDRNEGMRDLGLVHGPASINNQGQICATATDPNGQRRAFIIEPDGTRRWLGTLGGTSMAMAMNNHGQVVGESGTAGKWGTGRDASHAFLWDEKHGMRDLHPPGADQSHALAVNDRGQVLVYCPQQKVFIWDPHGGFVPVDPCELGPFFGFGRINNRGQTVLPSRSPRQRSRLLTSSTGAKWTTLFEFDGDVSELWLNDAGQVLFTGSPRRLRIPLLSRLFLRPLPRPCLWDPNRGLIYLDRYVSRETEMFLVVRHLNNRGCIVGFLRERTGHRDCAVLLEPVPERWGK